LAVVTLENDEQDFFIRVYDVATGRQVGDANGYAGRSASFSRDSNRIVTAPKLGVFDVRRPASEGRVIDRGNVEHESAVFSPDDKAIVAATNDGVIVVDIATGKATRWGPQRDNGFLAYSLKGDKILVATEKGAELWDATGRVITTVNRAGSAAAFTPDGNRFAILSEAGVQVWNADGSTASPLLPETSVRSIAFSPDGTQILTVGTVARTWDIAMGRQTGQTLGGGRFGAFSPVGRRVVVATRAPELDDPMDGAQIWEDGATHTAGVTIPMEHLEAKDTERSLVSVSPDGRRVVTSQEDGALVWDATTGKPVVRLRVGPGPAQPVFSPAGRRIAAAGLGIAQWDANTFERLLPPLDYPAKERLFTVQYSRDGRFLLARSEHQFWIWDAATGKPAGPAPKVPAGCAYALMVPDRRRAMVVCDRTTYVWDIASGKTEKVDALSLEFSPAGRIVLGTALDGLKVWDAATLRPVRRSPLETNTETEVVQFSPDGKYLVTVSAKQQKTAQIVDAETGKAVGPALRHESDVYSVAFSPDGRLAATEDGEAHLWEVKSGRPMSRPLRHDWARLHVTFMPDGQRVMVAERTGKQTLAHIRDILPPGSEAESKALADLAEIVSGRRVGELGGLVPMTAEQTRSQIRDLTMRSSKLDPRIAEMIRHVAAIVQRLPDDRR
jgi:WD40 repeat protein